jgi:hypothetical protein
MDPVQNKIVFRVKRSVKVALALVPFVIVSLIVADSFKKSDGTFASVAEIAFLQLSSPLYVVGLLVFLGSAISAQVNRLEFGAGGVCYIRWYAKNRCYAFAEISRIVVIRGGEDFYIELDSGKHIGIPVAYAAEDAGKETLEQQIRNVLDDRGFGQLLFVVR